VWKARGQAQWGADGPACKELLHRHRDELDRRLAGIEASRQIVQHGIDCRAEDFTRCPNFLRIVEEKAAVCRL
jgi:MerR family transcriptional regulator, copper efflux regulator